MFAKSRVATKAVTAVMMHGVKSVVYQHYIRLEQVWVLTGALGLDLWLAGCRTAV